jgi:hypothetical protein
MVHVNRFISLVIASLICLASSSAFASPSFFGMPFKPVQTAGAYGPLLAAVSVSAANGRDELKALFGRMTNFRFGLDWYLPANFGYVLLYLLTAGLSGAPLRSK